MSRHQTLAFASFLFIFLGLVSLLPVSAQEPVTPVEPTVLGPPYACPKELIASANFAHKEGFAYILKMKSGFRPDNRASNHSRLRLFEDGVELGPAHSSHTEIRTLGNGRSDNTQEALHMSASDNSNPSTNRKTYTYCIGEAPP